MTRGASFLQDLRWGVRVLAKSPGFTAVAVLSLALGIGANTAVFSLLNALLLRDLPVRQPERLVELSVARRGDKIPFSFPMLRELDRGQKVFSDLAGWTPGYISNVEMHGVPAQAYVNSVTGNFYALLGAAPLRGRLISPDDMNLGKPGRSPVAVLSFEYWQRRFGGAADAIGKEISIDGQPYTVIGVTRRWFTGMATGAPADLTIPMQSTDQRALLWVWITGRLKDGVSLAQARAQLQSFWPEVLQATPSTETPGLRRQAFFAMGLDVSSAATGVNVVLRSRFRRPLNLLMGIVGLILLVACVNLASLMLARAAVRSHEMTMRVALGAGRWRLARQVLTESIILSASGALLGLAFAYWGSRLLVGLFSQGYVTPIVLDLRPDGRVLMLTAAAAILTGILFGLAPAWRSSRGDPASLLQGNPRTLAGSTGKLGKALIVAQLALSMVLLLGAGLLARSFEKLLAIDPGIKESVLDVGLYPRPGGYQNLDFNSYHQQLISRIASLPGVESVGFSSFRIGDGGWEDMASTMPQATNPSAGISATVAEVSPGFMPTLGIAMLRGRDFDWTDDARHPRVAILSGSLAGRLFPSGNAIGQLIRFGFMPEYQNLEVVGVASDARFFDLHRAAEPVVYLPCFQHSTGAGDLLVRTRERPETMGRAVGQVIERMEHEYPRSTGTVAQVVSQALVEDRVIAVLSGFFAVLALLLASIGLYGLMSYAVAGRTREIGIRMALGAQRRTVLWSALRESLALALCGIALGIPCALAASRLIASMLFGVAPDDLLTIIAISSLLAVVAVLAAFVPARRASRVDPMVALRYE